MECQNSGKFPVGEINAKEKLAGKLNSRLYVLQ